MTSLQKLMRVIDKAEELCMFHMTSACKDELYQIAFLQEHFANERYDTMRAIIIGAIRDMLLVTTKTRS